MNNKKISNFHTHTYLCKHAEGRPIDYVKEASKFSCSALGFSDHCPYPDSSWSYCRMHGSEVDLYKSLVEEAAAEAEFPVYFGFECEWLPRFKSWYKDYLKDELKSDFLVLGSHWYDLNGSLEYIPYITNKKDIFGYIDFTITGMSTGIYSFLAHPDLFLSNVENIDSDYRACSKALIQASIEFNMPIEINGYGTFKRMVNRNGKCEYVYPVVEFWEAARDMGAKIICNSDAHYPEHTISGYLRAYNFAETLGIVPEDTASAIGLN
ncbi:PHP domain-containing protein [Treponema pedis]|uniref:PHP domain-containing protein n=1 Tax=Treponema pedis TaxID=409322 RepID=UPI0003F622D9|nr:PHP domain-containing protein [Treponema pedis]